MELGDDPARDKEEAQVERTGDGEFNRKVCWIRGVSRMATWGCCVGTGASGSEAGGEVKHPESQQDSKVWLEGFNQEGH